MSETAAQTIAPGEPIIVAQGIKAAYGNQTIFSGVDFTINRGEIIVVAGGSGCGKSTLLRVMIGLKEPDEGHVMVNGVDVYACRERELAQLRTEFGVLFQSGALLGSMTLAQNVSLPLQKNTRMSAALQEQVVRMKLSLVGLSGYDNHFPAELSGGMKKRAGLARAMALDPLVLFFDEPSAGLDPVTSAELDRLILELNAALGTTMVIVSHELASIYSIAHRVLMLDKEAKGLIAVGDPRELRDNSQDPKVRNFFLRNPAEPESE